MVPSVNKIPEAEIDNDTNFHFEMKQNVSETESKKQNKKAYVMPPSRHVYFHRILIFSLKMVELPQQHTNVTVH